MMNGRRKSDSCVVPTKSANKLTPVARAEQMEGRRLVKGNADACSGSRTLRRVRPAVALTRIRLVMLMLVVITFDKSRMR